MTLPVPASLLRVIAAVLIILGLGLLTTAGVQVVRRLSPPEPPPVPTALPPPMPPLPAGAEVDTLGRLTAWPGKTSVPCPAQTPGTAVILVLGQSNAGNHGEVAAAREPQPQVLNWHQGHCSMAASPLLGATGQGGEPWTLLADQLIQAHSGIDNVIIAPIVVAASGISRWVPGGDIDQQLLQDVRALQSTYRTTHVIWLQGETDFAAGTPQERYRSSLLSVIKTLRSVGVRAPVFVSVATRCGAQAPWRADNEVAQAQTAVVNPDEHILPGVYLDQVLGSGDRFDGCHLSAQGLRTLSSAWARLWLPG